MSKFKRENQENQVSVDALLDPERYNKADFEFCFRRHSHVPYHYPSNEKHPKRVVTCNLDVTFSPQNERIRLKFVKDTGRLVGVFAHRGAQDLTQQVFDAEPGSCKRQNTQFSRDVNDKTVCHQTEFSADNTLIADRYFNATAQTEKAYYDFIDVKKLMTTLSDVMARDDKADLRKRDLRAGDVPFIIECLEANKNDQTLKTDPGPSPSGPHIS